MADDAPATSDPKHRAGGGILWLIPLLLLAYLLSFGPVYKAFSGDPPRGVELIYAPLIFLYEKVPATRPYFTWYRKLWGW